MKIKNTSIAKVYSDAICFLDTGDNNYGKHQFICNAISESKNTNLAKRIATNIIQTRLGGGRVTMNCWLTSQGISDEHLTYRNVQAHRLAWLKALVEEFDKPGYYSWRVK